jgi:acyl-CoA synthetase (AMP-forming)/AMP-acid ligase II
MEIELATAWERVSDAVPEQIALIQADQRVSYRDFDDQAARFASAILAHGVQPTSKVALFLFNSPEYMIAEYGALKNRCTPVNVNYRYLDEELAYLIDNSDAEVLVFHSSLGDRVERVRERLEKMRLLVQVNDGGQLLDGVIEFDELIAAHDPQERQMRSGEDLYMMYTGGTTGMPKGVMSRQGPYVSGAYIASAVTAPHISVPQDAHDIERYVLEINEVTRAVSVPCCPLMHATGMGIAAIPTLLRGGTLVLLNNQHFDAHELWTLTERENVTDIIIVGDPFARPMLRALEEREGEGRPYDLTSLRRILSAGTIWSAEIKDGLRQRTSAQLMDLLGSTEGGIYALSSANKTAHVETANFALSVGTRVLNEKSEDVVAGSGEKGMIASATNTFGYYKDPEKTAATFREIDGQHYVLTGDWATVEVNGAITLLGRGSNCINTGGEKVFPEEVEEAVKRHPQIDDCLVVGLPDERFGNKVVAVASSSSKPAPSGSEVREWLATSLSHFKIPKAIVILDHVRRAPNGKADYGWARETLAANDVK